MAELTDESGPDKSGLMMNMSHDIRTPLNFIMGITDLLLDEEKQFDEARVRKDLLRIKGAGELLLGVVNDFLDISMIEAGKLELKTETYNTANILNDIVTLNKIRLDNNPVKFNVTVNEQLPCELNGDAQRIKQIINRLLGFAFQNTKNGAVTLDLDFKPLNDKTVLLIAAISGNDTEIIPDKLAKKLIEMMQGKIIPGNQQEKSSSVQVQIKQVIANDKIIGKEAVEKIYNNQRNAETRGPSKKPEYEDFSKKKVLVVDDFMTNLEITAGILRKYKINADCVNSGKKAVDLISAREPLYDAVFMDHMMPEMDGIEATRHIRDLNNDYARNIPIVALTANISAESERLYLDNGFNAFLSKPINMRELNSVLQNCLFKKQAEPASGNASPDGQDTSVSKPDPFDREIPGINLKSVFSILEGDKALAIFAFKSFSNNAPNTVERIRNVSEQNLPDYAIAIHSLKSMAATIGADDLSAKAKKLETLSRAGDLQGVLAENAEFVSNLEEFLRTLKLWLAESGN